tara:strand:+ start:625 stop:1437 length:813 start_codon:yes stop_codon:yes gene_type:complete
MINGIIACIMSSLAAFELTFPEQATGRDNEYADPSVLALWRGEVDPRTATVPEGLLPFATNDMAVTYGSLLLRSGRPSIRPIGDEGDNSDIFVEQCMRKIVPVGEQGLFEYRLPFRRLDSVIDPSSLQYIPQEISFGPKEKWVGDFPTREESLEAKSFLFGTGWSTTLAAETVQIAGNYIESKANKMNIGHGQVGDNGLEEYQDLEITNKEIADFITTSYMGHVHLRFALPRQRPTIFTPKLTPTPNSGRPNFEGQSLRSCVTTTLVKKL